MLGVQVDQHGFKVQVNCLPCEQTTNNLERRVSPAGEQSGSTSASQEC